MTVIIWSVIGCHQAGTLGVSAAGTLWLRVPCLSRIPIAASGTVDVCVW